MEGDVIHEIISLYPWMAQKLDMSYDWYESLMVCREKQTEWLSKLIDDEVRETGLKPVILGVNVLKKKQT